MNELFYIVSPYLHGDNPMGSAHMLFMDVEIDAQQCAVPESTKPIDLLKTDFLKLKKASVVRFQQHIEEKTFDNEEMQTYINTVLFGSPDKVNEDFKKLLVAIRAPFVARWIFYVFENVK